MYSDWGYKKRTCIWTNKKDWKTELCDGKGNCGNIIEIDTDGAIRRDTGKKIKTDKRLLHTNVMGNNEKKAINQYFHKTNLSGPTKIVKDVTSLIRLNTKALREKYKDYEGFKLTISGSTQKDRYRVPPELIYSLFLD